VAVTAAPAFAAYREEFRFGTIGTAAGQFRQPQGLAIDPQDGEVFVTDSLNSRVEVFGATGTFSRQFGTRGSGPGQLDNAEGIGVSPVAPFDVYVADTNNNRVERFTNAGVFLQAFGSIGAGPGQFEFPRNIAFDPQGNVYVGDTGATQRITKWSANGVFQGVIGSLQRLAGLTSSATELLASDSQANTVVRFGFDGSAHGTSSAGTLDARGLTVDNRGTVFVGDARNQFVRVLSPQGQSSFGRFIDPASLAYSSFNDRVYVLEGNNTSTHVSAWQEVPKPVLGKSMDIQVDSGTVLYKPPGAKKFKLLKKVSLVKSGTVIDARRGTVSITSIDAKGNLQSADFFKGVFKAIQRRKDRGLTEARLVGGNFKRCRASGARGAKKAKPVRQLWADGSGQFRTRGRYLSAAIRGTAWQTIDTCSGSTVKVTEGSVTVRDFLLKKTVIVNAGGFYSVTAPHQG
jgi:DNA-binding beta-propeller fold protein YncE